MLVRGQRWHVRNGNSIGVWQTPWLRSVENYFITSLCIQGLEPMKVRELLDMDGNNWN